MDSDERLESFLRQFRPRPASPLDDHRRPRRSWLRVAAVLLLGAVVVWVMTRSPSVPDPSPAVDSAASLTLGWVSRATAWDEERLDLMLIEMSPRVLPEVERTETLAVLARP